MSSHPRAALRALQWLVVLGLLGCGSAFLPTESSEERGPGTPLSRSEHPRAGELTWRLGAVQRTDDALRIDFTLLNGTSRNLEHGLLRVVLYGPDGEQLSARLPFMGIGRGRSQAMSARFASVPFRVADLGLELIFVTP